MTGKCLGCGMLLDPCENGIQSHFVTTDPFPSKYTLFRQTCPACHTELCKTINASRPMAAATWQSWREILNPQKDFILWDKEPAIAIDGSKPVVIYWAWMPVNDDNRLIDLMSQRISSDEDLRRNDYQTILIGNQELPPDILSHAGRFTQTILLKPHVLNGAWGPYPSLRAERSIARTWSINLRVIKHFWPSIQFPKAWYQALADDAELIRVWSDHYRRNLSVNTD